MNRCPWIAVFCLIILICFVVSVSHAGLIDFEDLELGSKLTDFESCGFIFSSSIDWAFIWGNDWPGIPSNGSQYMALGDSHGADNSITMRSSDGSAFSIGSIDIGEFEVHTSPGYSEDILVTGYYEAGGMIEKHLYPDGLADGPGGLDDFQTFYFNSDWKDLSFISFDSIRGVDDNYYQGWAMDNVCLSDTPISHVPEPSPIFLICSLFFLTGTLRLCN